MAWVLAGGLIYSAGALVYGFKRPNLIPGALASTSCGTSSSWQEAPATSGRCWATSPHSRETGLGARAHNERP
jgi:predicted membrane channel-forming protein YqfA (hemolysin III family)